MKPGPPPASWHCRTRNRSRKGAAQLKREQRAVKSAMAAAGTARLSLVTAPERGGPIEAGAARSQEPIITVVTAPERGRPN